jgi:manganese transport protein
LLWPAFAVAIVATEAAEFTGITIGLSLLGSPSVSASTAMAACIVFVLLAARGTVSRRLEWCAVGTTIVVAAVYALDCLLLHPHAAPIVDSLVHPAIRGGGAVLAITGIVGATIMPHNLFLHSGLVRERFREPAASGAKFRHVVATAGALGVATLVNAAILIVGNSVNASTIDRAFVALKPLAGNASAIAFGVALTLAGIAALGSSARAGDMVLNEGAPIHWSPVVRRLAGVGIAIALFALSVTPAALLIATQVILGLTLPLAVIPLVALAWRQTVRPMRVSFVLPASIVVASLTLVCDGTVLYHLFLLH